MSGFDLEAVQQRLREFAAARDWEQFHNPKNLATALVVEAAELVEIFQWCTLEQSEPAVLDEVTRARIVDEVADVCIYLGALRRRRRCRSGRRRRCEDRSQRGALPPAYSLVSVMGPGFRRERPAQT